ncbi:unnamed protein product [Pipistrellus nathusii]|uniref:Lymphotoxin-beta n=1 Tax=Pipistrellus nathusii TaxID=59473 RepID=A0ABP0AE85_PIPNA
MGALGLESWGRRPQGKSCLLLAVAGAASLVTLLLAVPITVLAVLVVAPPKPGLVAEPPDPGARALAQRRPGSQELPEQDAETDPSPGPPAAHLIGAWTRGGGLGWEAAQEEAFVRSGARFGAAGLALPRDGLYFLYCHVGYRGRAPAGPPPARALTLHSRLFRAGGAYGRGAPELLLEAAETVRPGDRADAAGRLWYASVGVGGLARLRRGELVFVNVSHPELVDARRGKTGFGAVLVG